jgi:hypothetical protein
MMNLVPQNHPCCSISELLERNNEQFEAPAFDFESGATESPQDVGRGILIGSWGSKSWYGVPEKAEHKI